MTEQTIGDAQMGDDWADGAERTSQQIVGEQAAITTCGPV